MNPPPEAFADSTSPLTTAPITTMIGISMETIRNCSEVAVRLSMNASRSTLLSLDSFSAIDLNLSMTLVSSYTDMTKVDNTLLRTDDVVALI